jgi:hypothetical protein
MADRATGSDGRLRRRHRAGHKRLGAERLAGVPGGAHNPHAVAARKFDRFAGVAESTRVGETDLSLRGVLFGNSPYCKGQGTPGRIKDWLAGVGTATVTPRRARMVRALPTVTAAIAVMASRAIVIILFIRVLLKLTVSTRLIATEHR